MRSPLKQSFLIQLVALALSYLSMGSRGVFIQPLLACILSLAMQQPWWWRVIHCLFVPLIVLMSLVNISSSVWFALFFASWLVFGQVYKNRVPLYLSSQRAVDALCKELPQGARVLDIGSGTGTILLGLSRRQDLQLCGVEHAWGPWLLGQFRLRLAHVNARLMHRDMLRVDWRPFNVVYAFLSPAAMTDVWNKARGELPSGAWLVSNSFPVLGQPSDRVIVIGESEGERLYLWQMP